MAISKVVYGTTVLVDLTSDTVDAAHLVEGYTAHDAAGNPIVGTLEQQGSQQESGNLLEGVTPSLLNGATQNGKTYVIPSGGRYGTDYIEYKLDIPTLTAYTAYCLLVYGKMDGGSGSVGAKIYHQNPDGGASYDIKSGMYFKTEGSFQTASFNLASGAKPTKIVIYGAGYDYPFRISSITLTKLDA